MNKQLNARIVKLDTKISALEAEMILIKAETTDSDGIKDCFDARYIFLENQSKMFLARKARAETGLTQLATEWNTEQQRTIDGISKLFETKYDDQLEFLKSAEDTKQITFFKLYDATTNDFQRSLVIKEVFNLP